VASQLATLQLCAVTPLRSLAAVTAAGWCNRLLRLGVALPLFVVHDVGWLLAAPADALRRRVPQATTAEAQALCAGYSSLLDRLSSSPIVETTTSMRLRDELIAVLLTRIFGQLSAGYQRGATPLRLEPLPLEPGHYKPSPAPGELLDDALGFLRFLLEPDHCLHLLTAVEIIDVQMLRLLSTGQKARRETQAALENDRTLEAADGLDLIDLLQAVTAPEVRDVARFSMDLLPSVLETRRSAGSQHYPIGGYASLERRGSLDAVLWSELASDDEMFFLRLSENELLYHGRERRQDEGRGEHHILIDASASMHGLRQVFARGLAIALAQKLLLLGATVKLRFFDGRLHEPLQGDLSTALPYLLSFRSSRGRNYGRVFQDLLRELQGQGQGLGPASLGASLRGPKAARVQALHVITHGECHIATATVQALSGLAELHGVFMLPSSELALDYLPLLTSCAVITDEDLREPTARRQKALRIVDGIEKKPAR
jgi:hypothetical protein